MITVHDLRVTAASGAVLLTGARLAARAGRLTAVQGPSGAGKTTLLRALVGDAPAGATVTAATLDVLGDDPFTLSPARLRDLRSRRVAYVGQDPGSALNPTMSVRRLVAETAADPSSAGVLDALSRCSVPTEAGMLRRRPGALSGGQQRRVALARAVAKRPRVLLLDEPTAGLDRALRVEIAQLLRSLADEGTAVVLACHDDAFVLDHADDVVRVGSTPLPAPVHTSPVSAGPVAGTSSGLAAVELQLSHPAAGGRRHTILSAASLAVQPGTSLGLVGVSGSGKSSLLRALAGLHRPDAGTVTLDGEQLAPTVAKRSAGQLRRVQLVAQNPLAALNPARTAGHTLARPLRLHRMVDRADEPARVRQLLDRVHLPADVADRYPHELSGGQRQRVSLARALAVEPDYLLCDEITTALDSTTAAGILGLLRELRVSGGLGLVLVSHDEALIAEHTDHTHRLES